MLNNFNTIYSLVNIYIQSLASHNYKSIGCHYRKTKRQGCRLVQKSILWSLRFEKRWRDLFMGCENTEQEGYQEHTNTTK